MLIEFSVGNYRSFLDPVTLSLVAADISSKPAELDTNNRFQVAPDLHLLTSAAIYGANASGKSNLIKALNFMRTFVLTSSRETQTLDRINVDPFLLSTATINQPTFFEIVFRIEGTQYRYGFEVTRQRVVGEWLFYLSSSRESTLFTRDQDGIQVSTRNFREGKGLEEHTRENALFLSVVAQFNGKIATTLLKWFGRLIISTGIEDRDFGFAVLRHADSSYRDAIEQFIRRLDVGITGFTLEKIPASPSEQAPNFPPEIAEKWLAFVEALKNSGEGDGPFHINIKTQHQRFDAEGQAQDQVAFDLEQESDGTQRLFAFAEPVIHALDKGRVLVIDEFDARIHPNLVIELLRLFNSPTTNPHHAQLVFATHNTNLLSSQLLRRDQVWFVEKTSKGASDLYSLVEYRTDGKKVRNDASFEKNYIEGRYGSIPFTGDLEQWVGSHIEQKETAG
jgi:hypothetical protein